MRSLKERQRYKQSAKNRYVPAKKLAECLQDMII